MLNDPNYSDNLLSLGDVILFRMIILYHTVCALIAKETYNDVELGRLCIDSICLKILLDHAMIICLATCLGMIICRTGLY